MADGDWLSPSRQETAGEMTEELKRLYERGAAGHAAAHPRLTEEGWGARTTRA